MIPTDIAGCSCWFDYAAGHSYLDAGSTPATTNGDLVQQITDESGSGNNGTQPTSGQRVQIDTTENAWKFSGGQIINLGDIFAAADDFTGAEIIVLLKAQAMNIVNGLWTMSHVNSGFIDTLYPYSNGLIYETALAGTRRESINPGVSLSTQYRVYSIRGDQLRHLMWIDNTLISDNWSNGFKKDSAPIIGKNANNFFWTGWIKQFASFPFKLKESQRMGLAQTMLGTTFSVGAARMTAASLDLWTQASNAAARDTQEYLDNWTQSSALAARITQEYLDVWGTNVSSLPRCRAQIIGG